MKNLLISKVKKRVVILIGVLALSTGCFGQLQFSLDLSGTYSFMAIKDPEPRTPISPTTGYFVTSYSESYSESYNVKPGLNLNFGVSKQLKNRFSIHSGLGLSFQQYQKIVVRNTPTIAAIFQAFQNILDSVYFVPSITSNAPELQPTVVSSSDNGKTRILYVSIPVTIDYQLIRDKFSVGLGIVNYLVASSSQIRTINNFTGNLYTQYDQNDKSSNGLNNYLLSGNFSMKYKLFKSIWGQLSYTHSFSKIYDEATDPFQLTTGQQARYRTIGFGLSYAL